MSEHVTTRGQMYQTDELVGESLDIVGAKRRLSEAGMASFSHAQKRSFSSND